MGVIDVGEHAKMRNAAEAVLRQIGGTWAALYQGGSKIWLCVFPHYTVVCDLQAAIGLTV